MALEPSGLLVGIAVADQVGSCALCAIGGLRLIELGELIL
jgi:hypothetical protein